MIIFVESTYNYIVFPWCYPGELRGTYDELRRSKDSVAEVANLSVMSLDFIPCKCGLLRLICREAVALLLRCW